MFHKLISSSYLTGFQWEILFKTRRTKCVLLGNLNSICISLKKDVWTMPYHYNFKIYFNVLTAYISINLILFLGIIKLFWSTGLCINLFNKLSTDHWLSGSRTLHFPVYSHLVTTPATKKMKKLYPYLNNIYFKQILYGIN